MAHKKIAIVTVGAGGASSIEFTSIPQTYDDLYIVLSGRSTGVGGEVRLSFNGTTTNYTTQYLQCNTAAGTPLVAGVETSSQSLYPGELTYSTMTTDAFGSTTIYITNY